MERFNTFLTFTCTNSNIFSLPVLHCNFQYPYLLDIATPFYSSTTILITIDTSTNTYTYSPKNKYEVGDKLYTINN